jgi:hypothetical protein
MPPKAKIPAPIDRPLSKAYLRQFTGWATAEPPGVSDPTSLRVMENVLINRDGSARIRPGLRYLSYAAVPGDEGSPAPSWPLPSNPVYNQANEAGELGDIWVDEDDATYTQQWKGWFPAPPGPGYGGVFPDFSGGLLPDFTGDPALATEILVHARVSATSSTGDPLLITADLYGPLDHALPVGGATPPGTLWALSQEETVPGDGVIRDFSWTISPATYAAMFSDDPPLNGIVYTAEDVATLLQNLPTLEFYFDSADSTPDRELRVYEASVEVRGEGVEPSLAYDRPFVGTHEAFYLDDGSKAYLVAVREEDGTVGFRVMGFDGNVTTMMSLDHPDIDFELPSPHSLLNFTADTTYVKYLQIDNKVFALSDNGENMRVFTVGTHKTAKALTAITRPEWEVEDKLTVVHPEADWITSGEPTGVRRNKLTNPSFEENLVGWRAGPATVIKRPQNPPDPVSGNRMLRMESRPERTNLASHPLHDVATTGVTGWSGAPYSGSSQIVGQEDTGGVGVVADGSWLKVELPADKATFFAQSKMLPEVEDGVQYQVALDFDEGTHVIPRCRVRWLGVNGAKVGDDVNRLIDGGIVTLGVTRWVSAPMTAPKGAVSMRLFIGGENLQKATTHVRAKNIVICPADESTDMFTGDDGADYFWMDGANSSGSVYHPPKQIGLISEKVPVGPGKPLSGSLYVQADTTVREATLQLRVYNKDSELVDGGSDTPTDDVVGTPTRLDFGVAAVDGAGTQADLKLVYEDVPRGEYHWVDAAMIEVGTSTPDTYFDGSTTDVPMEQHSWKGARHASVSLLEEFTVGASIPDAETRTTDTLVATGGPSVNVHQFGFFYTFNNEVGESAASRITIKRAQRAWSDWVWETPNVDGEPSGTDTGNPERAADQLVAIMPEDVFDEAMAQGATSWSLYMFTWSDQDAVPVAAVKIDERELPPDALYGERGWIRVTPVMADSLDDSLLPTKKNRYNYSDPSRGGQGLVAADRMILVNDPTAAAVIRWTSNRLGEYTNFTANKGGGYKTLTSGNLFVPAAVKLWQNPQSADTITILCLGTDGHSTSYYMAPAQVASQSDATNVMGFEETTATPGTTSPYGVEVFNNSLYHPCDDQLMKSTASNYNINHKSQTDLIRDMWEKLADKYWIISSQNDGRLYYIVNNPEGEQVEPGCKGNEIWVFDSASKTGTWSRFLIQAMSLRKIEFGGQIYMSVIRPDGVYYLDPEYGHDEVVGEDLVISRRPIPWRLETNTQGANRAHDAWCHLQQLSVSLGYFQGRMRFGLRSVDIHGKAIDMHKIVRDKTPPTSLAFDIEDQLAVRRDLKEWFFYAESVFDEAGEPEYSFGQVSLVQYRYTPSSVNTGYELGSVETFQYGRDVAEAPSTTTDNGIPLPLQDTRRP